METILVLILILILGYTGAHLYFYESRIPMGTRYLLSAGSEYLFLGLILGSTWLMLLTPEQLDLLTPAVNLGLGWIGFLFGIQFEWQQLRRIPLRFFGITITQALITFFGIWGGLLFVSGYLPLGLDGATLLLIAVVTSLSSPTCLAFVESFASLHPQTVRLSRYISILDPIVGLLLFGMARSLLLNGGTAFAWLDIPIYLILATCLIVLFHLLTRFYLERMQLLILIIGLVVFSSGLAGAFNLSALLLNLLLGIGIINLPSLNHRELTKILTQQEKPVYVIFLVLAGAMWQPLTTNLIILAVCLLFRFGSKWLGSAIAVKTWGLDFKPPATWGWSLFPQGGMGIALVVDYLQYHPGTSGVAVLNIILASTLATQLMGPLLIQKSLRRDPI